MTSTKRLLLGTAAATVAVAAGGGMAAQAADIAVKKAPPIQYVRICDQYGAGFWQIPGSSICLQIRGQFQSDNAYQPTHDILLLTPSKTNGTWSQAFQAASQQDKWGYEVTSKTRFDMRTETSLGTLRAYIELKVQLDAGAFNAVIGPGIGETGAGNKSELYRGYVQWAGFTLGSADSIWSLGGFKDGEVANVIQSDKSSGWTAYYTWTPSGPGVPPKRGSAPVPDGWSFSFGVDTPLKHISKNQFGGGCTYYDLTLTAGSPAGLGSVCAQTGPLTIPDFVGRIHYEGDPAGKDPQNNDQFGLGSLHLSGAWHQITTIGVGSKGDVIPILPVAGSAACGGLPAGGIAVPCAFGPAVTANGWAVNGAWKFFVPMWSWARLGPLRASAADNIAGNIIYANGALEYGGIGGTNGNLGAGDAYWTGGLARDDTDGRWINNGFGSYSIDKEKDLLLNFQYDSILTDCTDPVKCVRLNLEANYVWVTPGSITQNVDWTLGGLGKARKMALTGELSFGANSFGTTRPTFWRLDLEVQYLKVWQDLPCANNGNTALAVCGTPTTLPFGITKDPDTYVFRATLSKDW